MNTYIAFFNGKQITITAANSCAAQQEAVKQFKPAKSKQHMVHVHLHEKNGEQVIHSTTSV